MIPTFLTSVPPDFPHSDPGYWMCSYSSASKWPGGSHYLNVKILCRLTMIELGCVDLEPCYRGNATRKVAAISTWAQRVIRANSV
jgi:hypothetical protein